MTGLIVTVSKFTKVYCVPLIVVVNGEYFGKVNVDGFPVGVGTVKEIFALALLYDNNILNKLGVDIFDDKFTYEYFNECIKINHNIGGAYLNRGIAYFNIGYFFNKGTKQLACNDYYTGCRLGEPKACTQYNNACR